MEGSIAQFFKVDAKGPPIGRKPVAKGPLIRRKPVARISNGSETEEALLTESLCAEPDLDRMREAAKDGARNFDAIVDAGLERRRVDFLRLADELCETYEVSFDPQKILRVSLKLHWDHGTDAAVLWGASPALGLEEAVTAGNWEGVAMAVRNGAKNLRETVESVCASDRYAGFKKAKKMADRFLPEKAEGLARRMLLEAAAGGNVRRCEEAVREGGSNFQEALEWTGGNIETMEFLQEEIRKEWSKGIGV